MDSRTTEPCDLKWKLGFSLLAVINTKEQTVLKEKKGASQGENMQN